uniref:Glycosyltransferase family 1 protein n=1 Tax=candidate division WOR-3 bacterium TaxID=2052148 RepID=A0A7C3UPD5_UNCW3
MRNREFDWIIFGTVPYHHLLRGRVGALIDELRERGFFLYYLPFPPGSVCQYFRGAISPKKGFCRFLFPKPQTLSNLKIFWQPPVIPSLRYETDLTRRIYQDLIFKRILKTLYPFIERRKRGLVGLIVTPWWYEVAAKIHRRVNFLLRIYDCIDDLRIFCNENQYGYYSQLQRKLVKDSDLILISAQRLREDIIRIRPDAPIEYLPNGVDFDLFIKNGLNASPPPDLEKLPRPIIGFVGALSPWIDINLIVSTAQSFPKASIVLIGPIHEIEIPHLPNIYLLGPRPYSLIPGYVNHFDVCLIPFLAGSISDKVDPIKVYEYLSLGKPVVACHLPELEKMQDLIYLTDNEKDFIAGIEKALRENDEDLKRRRMEYAQKNSWEVRVSQLLEIVGKRLKRG